MNGVDDDNDGLIDMNDSGCGNPFDGSESDAAYGPDGQVLGASTSAEAEDDSGASCPASFAAFIGLNGTTPDPEAVKALQQFLNTELGLTLDVNGDFDAATIDAVKAFQTKYALEVLAPWGITDATGIVFKTTQRMINMILCPGLDLPMPELN
jgi:peptidoglycan hydrolase-like protein with peptidoglycan-binding domain